ncbi:MAG: hypothetical protein PWQ88_985 [Candidatus Methanomethylophilaceae archaeon]|nr:hypothetical protein [Candidatus Methanomethylophilaceae archaeon]
MMKYDEYKNIYRRLNSPADIDKLEKKGYDRELLVVLYTQKTTREVKKNFYKVKNNTKRMLKEWRQGKTLMEISEHYRFPPILTAMFVFQEMGWSKKKFWANVRGEEEIKDPRIKKEIEEINKNDYVYSPWANEDQRRRGDWGESLLENWLDSQGVEYRTEDDIRGVYAKTPDCLFEKPIKVDGKEILWIESKATFGDAPEFRFNANKQLIPYTEIFGPGMVIYWFGHLDDLDMPENVYIIDRSLLDLDLEDR